MSNAFPTKPITGWHIAVIFFGFFGVIFAVNIGMAVMAYRSWTGLVVENSYVASQQFNTDVAALRKSELLGISHQLHFENGKLYLSLIDAAGRPIKTDRVQISIGRPVDDGEDQKLIATQSGNGRFEVIAKLGNGIWSGELSARLTGNQLWRHPFKLTVSDQ